MSPSTAIDRPSPVRAGEELDTERLRSYLAQQLGDDPGDIEVQQFPRGFSNLTYLVRWGERELVLRRPPFGTRVRSAHDMGREHHILSHLHTAYPKAPRPLLYCDDAELLGAPFYVMERVRGVILRGEMPADSQPAPGTMREIARAFVDTFAELHAVDFEAVGLGELGRPEGYVRRQVDGWAKRYRKSRTDDLAPMERVAAWLGENAPPESGAALIHNDFKYDNLVFDPQDPSRVLAVLDWEMATVGDPLMDLGTSLGYWIEPGDPPPMQALRLGPSTLPGNPTRSELVERYERATGNQVGNVVFYYVFGLFKIAVIIQQIYYRYRRGHTEDPRFEKLIQGVAVCGQAAAQVLERGRIDNLFGP